MLRDPIRVEEVGEWLTAASRDLDATDARLDGAAPIPDVAVFHCQQAAEKTLKAFLVWHDVPFRKTHNLEELGEQCLTIDSPLRQVVDRATSLTEYAWKFRYPGEPEAATRSEADDARARAKPTTPSSPGSRETHVPERTGRSRTRVCSSRTSLLTALRPENLKRLLEVALDAGELSRQLRPALTHRADLLDRLLASV